MSYKNLTFSKLIRRNEFRALIGWRYQALIFLSTILFFTFLCFGFAWNAREQVRKLSKNPLSNWVNIKFTGRYESALNQLYRELENGSVKESYMIRNADFYTSGGFTFLNKSHKKSEVFDYRTIDPASPIVEDLVNKINLEVNYYPGTVSETLDTMPEGLIVTRNLLEQLGYRDEKIHHLFLLLSSDSTTWKVMALPIVAIVNGLPEQVEVVCTNRFLCNKNTASFYWKDIGSFKLLIEDIDKEQAVTIREEIANLLGIEYEGNITAPRDTIFLPDTVVIWRFYIPDEGLAMSNNEKFSLIKEKVLLLQDKHFGFYTAFEMDRDCNNSGQFQDYLAVDFQRLDKIRDFDHYIKENFGVSINMETLTQRENYLFIGNLALAAILMVIVFCVFSLTLYISETFKNHILKVKKNLGNLMALGASNNDLIRLYVLVALKMLVYAIIIAFVISFAFGWVFEEYILERLIVLQAGEDYFNLLNPWLILFIILILFIALLMTFLTISRILKVSPGDLIYERNNMGNTSRIFKKKTFCRKHY
jgi:hypothetical protein